MKYLWIGGRRVDGLKMLRELFKEESAKSPADSDELRTYFLDMYDKGHLPVWLTQQEEYYQIAGKKKNFSDKLKMIVKLYEDGVRTYENRNPDLYILLYWLVTEDDTEAENIKKSAQKWFSSREEERTILAVKGAKKSQNIAAQQKYDDSVHEDNKNTLDYEWTATSGAQLNEILGKIRKDIANGKEKHRVITVFRIDKDATGYSLDLRGIGNITLKGEGDPVVRYFDVAEDTDIDLGKNNIVINDMTIRFRRKYCFKNTKGCGDFVPLLRGSAVKKDE